MQYGQTKVDFAIEPIPSMPAAPRRSFIRTGRSIFRTASVRVLTAEHMLELSQPWQDLQAQLQGSTPYQSYSWCAAWIDACAAIGRPIDVRIVTVWEADRLVLLWPMALRHLGPIGILHALAEPATQYCDALVERSQPSAEWIELAWRQMRAEHGVDIVHLRNVRDDGGLNGFCTAHLASNILSRDVSPFLKLKDAEDDQIGRPKVRSGRSVNALKRHWRNLEKIGPVEFQVVPIGQHAAAVAEALELKRLWLAERGEVSAGYDHPANRAAISELARRGHFLILRLSVGGKTAALEIGLVEKGYYASLIQSYDLRLAAHAPGRLLLWKLFSGVGTELGIETFDFLPPAHPHKTEWTDAAVVVSDYVVPFNFRGRLAKFYLRTGKGWIKRAIMRLPMRVRTRVVGVAHRFY